MDPRDKPEDDTGDGAALDAGAVQPGASQRQRQHF
jgi:hypothetical protein